MSRVKTKSDNHKVDSLYFSLEYSEKILMLVDWNNLALISSVLFQVVFMQL